jgi:RNA polymerase sigma factor (sigma-70 family)
MGLMDEGPVDGRVYMIGLTVLVERSQKGDLDAFAEMVRRFQDMAHGYAYAILGDFHLAEDVAQEAFIDTYRKLGVLRTPAAFPGWFRRILFKHCDRITRKKKVPVVPFDECIHVPKSNWERSELQDEVLKAIRGLPDSQREATTLFYINGYSQKEIAEFLEVPVTTVQKRLYDSRKRLKERMVGMVEKTLKQNAPDERFSQKVIASIEESQARTDAWGAKVSRGHKAAQDIRSQEEKKLESMVSSGLDVPEWAKHTRVAMPDWGFEPCSHRWLDGLDAVMDMIHDETYRPRIAGCCGDVPGWVAQEAEKRTTAVEHWLNDDAYACDGFCTQVAEWLGEPTPEKKEAATCYVEIVRAYFFKEKEDAASLAQRWRDRSRENVMLLPLFYGEGLDGGLACRCGYLTIYRLDLFLKILGGKDQLLDEVRWFCETQLRHVQRDDPTRLDTTIGYLWGLHACLSGKHADWLRQRIPACAGAAVYALNKVGQGSELTPLKRWLVASLLSKTAFFCRRAISFIDDDELPEYAKDLPVLSLRE